MQLVVCTFEIHSYNIANEFLYFFQKNYLSEKFKVDGKVKNFGNKVTFELKDDVITLTCRDFTFSKRSVKFINFHIQSSK